MIVGRTVRLAVLWSIVLAAIVGVAFVPSIPQPMGYHEFADTRALFGIPNFWNVASNLPFLATGAIGLIVVARNRYAGGLPSLRIAYALFFVSVSFVCFGSGYYHWSPSNETLAWDRLPMAIAFMTLVAIVIGEHINERAALRLLLPLIAVGVFSVCYWRYTEDLGHGDLRLYGLVQFLSLVIVALIFWLFPSRLSGIGYLWAMFAGYAIAKLLEEFDAYVYDAFGHQVSGHALKHVVAAGAMYCFLLALQRRRLTMRLQ
ncbi:MAG TPA: ceramidase domain-containing protein [Steroidobacteraceae bacterium]|nr:ceramidase domain-containing protein [Steroidobacteraceae bacterium]